MLYADVILPLPLQDTYTYSVPKDIQDIITEGSRVIVQFGQKKLYTAIVLRVYKSEVKTNIKEIVSALDKYPIINRHQLEFWQWTASYYLCTLGDVYKAAIPSALKLESETYVIKNPEYASDSLLTINEQKIFNSLSSTKASKISEIAKSTNIQNPITAVKSLNEKGCVLLNEDIGRNYSPKTTAAVKLFRDFTGEEINTQLDILERHKKQQHLLFTFLRISENNKIVFKKELLEQANVTQAVLDSLVKKDILTIYNHEINRIDYGLSNIDAAHTLNKHQLKAYEEIKSTFAEKDVTLLHGVTASGKTEIYIQLIKDVISQGGQVLYLLPEIALTTQITERLKSVFGNKLAVYHSKFNENERAETWNKLLKNTETQVVLGARSAIFLPFNDLKLVVVDEEHESSYKQQDPAPRYNARNLSMVLAGLYNAKTLLGTATPAIETYYNALTGKYGLVKLTKRHDNIALPEIQIVNTKELRRKKLMKSILSPPLIKEIDEALEKKEQIILFQNRRGFSSMIECRTCSWTPRCQHCDVSLTYHKGQNVMVCHYCGATYSVPKVCPECETPSLSNLGYGTERVEEEVKEQFPTTKSLRMDLDTTRGKRAYERIITDFASNKAGILIGTQMISKGLDFDNVSIVGILNADNMLNYPDFRAHERAYQMIIQVSGRAGRKNKQGLVALQTGQPAHPVITFAMSNDYDSFFNTQLSERQLFRYPPFYRLISIIIRGKHEHVVEQASKQFAQSLRQPFGERVLGPSKPPVSRIQTLFIRKIMLKIEHQASIKKVRSLLSAHQKIVFTNTDFKSIIIHYDIDPM